MAPFSGLSICSVANRFTKAEGHPDDLDSPLYYRAGFSGQTVHAFPWTDVTASQWPGHTKKSVTG